VAIIIYKEKLMSSLFSRNTPEYKQGARKFVDTVQASLGNPTKKFDVLALAVEMANAITIT
jgi:hypothetical protein